MAALDKIETLAGLSVKTLLLSLLGILVFGIYVAILMYGENSLTVLNDLKKKKETLLIEGRKLKIENQHLQKEFFELKQLEPNG